MKPINACTECLGEGLIDAAELGEPIDEHGFVECPNCGGSGKAEDMTIC